MLKNKCNELAEERGISPYELTRRAGMAQSSSKANGVLKGCTYTALTEVASTLNEEGLQIMRYLGRNMAWLLKLKVAGEKTGVLLPEQEETRIATNFIITLRETPIRHQSVEG